jgi:hypothetical protein
MEINKTADKSDTKIVTICSCITLAIFVIDSLLPLGIAGGVPYILVILISLWGHKKRLPVYMAIAATVLTIIGFYLSPTGGEVLWKVLTNRALDLIAIWLVAILSVQRRTLHEENEKALQEIKVLSGFLPICASCNKIRDDKGCWNQIESYISDHSEAEFSHGICPDCAKKLYPDLY